MLFNPNITAIKPAEYQGKVQLCAHFKRVTPRFINHELVTEVALPQHILEARNRPEEQLALTQLQKANAAAQRKAAQPKT